MREAVRAARLTTILGLGTAFAFVMGCAQIAGIEDWTPEEDGTGGTGGTGGSSEAGPDGDGSTTCTGGEFRCSGLLLEQCASDGSGWNEVEICASAALCDVTAKACLDPLCGADDTRCLGAELQRCDADRTGWATVSTCPSSALCDEEAGQCLSAACADSEYRCDGANLQLCKSDRTGWDTVETCATAAYCDASGAKCDPPVCLVGEHSCDGKKLRICNAAQNGWNQVLVCGPSEICDAEGAHCDVCVPGTWQCAGSSLQRCSADGQAVETLQACASSSLCSAAQGTCLPASCAATGPGTGSDCGSEGTTACCSTSVASGGTFDRSNEPSFPATVSSFRMDVFEVTVGRFRTFVASGSGTQAKPPAAGAGAHPGVTGSGWSASWNDSLVETTADLHSALMCDPTFGTWTSTAGTNERLPMGCVTWFEAFAFCAWDGGRLAMEAEWNYAAAGGDEQRVYPWGATIDATRAAYDCRGDGSVPGDCSVLDILRVGSRSTAGDGRWGHADLSGNVAEWALDAFLEPYPMPCQDCAALTGSTKVVRGGGFDSVATDVTSLVRGGVDPSTRSADIGIRCVRLY